LFDFEELFLPLDFLFGRAELGLEEMIKTSILASIIVKSIGARLRPQNHSVAISFK